LTIILVTHDPRVAEKVDRVVAIRDGRTSTETLPGTASNAAFHPQEVLPSGFQPANAEEVILLDQAGRLQLPDEQRALAGIGRRARVELVAGGVLIKPDERGLTRMSLTEKLSNTDPEYHRLYQADTAHGERVNAGQRAPWWARWGKHRR
jgi:peptide/nickel transport system ATP-binding protein